MFDPKKATTFSLLTKLDEVFSPGLPENVFVGLFMRCRVCHYTMTKHAFPHHLCLGERLPSARRVIDLTLDDTESDTESDTEPDE